MRIQPLGRIEGLVPRPYSPDSDLCLRFHGYGTEEPIAEAGGSPCARTQICPCARKAPASLIVALGTVQASGLPVPAQLRIGLPITRNVTKHSTWMNFVGLLQQTFC